MGASLEWIRRLDVAIAAGNRQCINIHISAVHPGIIDGMTGSRIIIPLEDKFVELGGISGSQPEWGDAVKLCRKPESVYAHRRGSHVCIAGVL